MNITSAARLSALLLAVATALSACEKPDLIGSPEKMLCPGGSVSANTAFKSPIPAWQDDFRGMSDANETDPPECFSDAMATCSQRVDWFMEGPCTHSISHLGALNKCRWTVWDGGSTYLATNPNQVSIDPYADTSTGDSECENGHKTCRGSVKIKVQVRPDSEAPFKCGASERDRLAGDYYDTNCKVLVGGIDSRHRPDTKVRNPNQNGRTFTNGRMEIRARMNIKDGLWPALWTWRTDIKKGDTIGEIDILEVMAKSGNTTVNAQQTYHTWSTLPPDTHLDSGGKYTRVESEKFTTYGVERSGKKIKFFVNDCYTRTLTEGEDTALDKNGNPMTLDGAIGEFLIISMGITEPKRIAPTQLLNNGELEVDWVKFYDK